ncbi:phage tail tape measure protein [Vallitalea guaymasensis]|uniref:phage tail tape measure protein n=1 Tax=Vallitalea guaymasensis TaxID=1185412 RepID=UPI000DE36272|nr:phage tail tape measure protein [Vallitalea guaymasensis]
MSLDTVFKLSVIVNMIDNLTAVSRQVNKSIDQSMIKYEKMQKTYGTFAKTGAMMAMGGVAITKGILSPVEATFKSKKALGELSSVGVENLEAIEDAATNFSDTWSGVVKDEFISSAYDIKSGISSLTDEAIAQFTTIANLTAKATKSTAGEMTSLFATGYGIYKDYYNDLTDLQFAEMFSAGISQSVKQFKTTGSQMASSISSLGASATNAQIPLEEQFAILGMLQQTMSGSEAGTKYRAFLKSAAKAGQMLELSFMDANNQLLSLPEILSILQGKFGDTLDAAEKLQLQKAFGTEEAIALLNLFYTKTGELETNILGLNDKLGQGTKIADEMANVMNKDPSSQYQLLKQQIHNVKEELGEQLLPTYMDMMNKNKEWLTGLRDWITDNQELAGTIMKIVLFLGIFLGVAGSLLFILGTVGTVVTNGAMVFMKLLKALKYVKSGFETLRIVSMFAKDAILKFARTTLISGLQAVKNFTVNLFLMAKQAIVTAVTSLPPLIASVWSFTAALLANPITWIVIGIIALVTAIVLLWRNWDKVSNWISNVWNSVVDGVIGWFNRLRDKLANINESIRSFLVNAIKGAIEWFNKLIDKIAGINDSIKMFLANAIANIINWFKELPVKIKQKFDSMLGMFRESGKKIMETLGKGIMNGISAPFRAVKTGLAKIRKLLPFSDAKEGPLSQLTLSGRKIFDTLVVGMEQSAPHLKETSKNAFEDMNGVIESNDQAEQDRQHIDGESVTYGFGDKHLEVHVHFDKIQELKKVLGFIKELEEYKEVFER